VYICSFTSKDIYTYQVGVYKDIENRDEKLKWLKQHDIEGYTYKKDGLYYVVSLISENYEDINNHSNKVKGIVKKYNVKKTLTNEELFELLKE
jgi:hypothetical protein